MSGTFTFTYNKDTKKGYIIVFGKKKNINLNKRKTKQNRHLSSSIDGGYGIELI